MSPSRDQFFLASITYNFLLKNQHFLILIRSGKTDTRNLSLYLLNLWTKKTLIRVSARFELARVRESNIPEIVKPVIQLAPV